MKKIIARFLTITLIACMLTIPAQAYTATTLGQCRNYFVFEGGVINAEWEKHTSAAIENGKIMVGKTHVTYTPIVYIPLGSKISLTQSAINQGYKMTVYENSQAIIEEVTSYTFNSESPLEVGIYTLIDERGIHIDYSIKVVGVKNGVAAELDTPFVDIGYFKERYYMRGLYGQLLTGLSDTYISDITWFYQQGITSGTSANTFSPFDYVTRAQVVQFLWNYNGSPEPEYRGNPFVDVKETDYYYKAVMWAYENNITSGVSATEFGPNNKCPRNQAVTLIGNAFHCELPNEVYDEHISGTPSSRTDSCLRVDMAHYFHYAYEYTAANKA